MSKALLLGRFLAVIATCAAAPALMAACSAPPLPADAQVIGVGGRQVRPLPYALADAPTVRAATAEVFVNSPAHPVVLMLGSAEPMRWVVRRTAATAIAVVYASGPFKAVVEGLDDGTPLLHGSAGGDCPPFRLTEDHLTDLNPAARRVFARPVDLVHFLEDGRVFVGVKAPENEYRSPVQRPIATVLVGDEALEAAIARGEIRRANWGEVAAWQASLAQASRAQGSPPEHVHSHGSAAATRPASAPYRAFVVLRQFTFPAGLHGGHGADFYVPVGVPLPTGDPGHSRIFDLNRITRSGPP